MAEHWLLVGRVLCRSGTWDASQLAVLPWQLHDTLWLAQGCCCSSSVLAGHVPARSAAAAAEFDSVSNCAASTHSIAQ
jgi:hypothetical protein